MHFISISKSQDRSPYHIHLVEQIQQIINRNRNIYFNIKLSLCLITDKMDSCQGTNAPPAQSLLASIFDRNTPSLGIKRRPSLLADRYIPVEINFDTFSFRNIDNKTDVDPNQNKKTRNLSLKKRQSLEKYQSALKRNLSNDKNKEGVLNYFEKRKKKEGFVFGEDREYEEEEPIRSIAKKPYKVLEVPDLKDDFYCNVVDWSKSDIVATALKNEVYLYQGSKDHGTKLSGGKVSSLKFSSQGLAVGDEYGNVRLFDITKKKMLMKISNHASRVGTIDFSNNLMVTGSKDNKVIVHDIRTNKFVNKFHGHSQEVCGAKWSFDGYHFASGGNDNKVFVWSLKMNQEVGTFTDHSAAVKGLAWSPHKHSILATGGGTSDKTVKIWNTHSMKMIQDVETGSQVCNMMFSQNSNQLVTTHGYSFNTINVWRQKDMKKLATLYGHEYRVLYLAMSPDGESIVTGSGDETLRFWKIFPSKSNQNRSETNLDWNNCVVR